MTSVVATVSSPTASAVSLALVDLDDGIRIMARCAPSLTPGAGCAGSMSRGSKAGRPQLVPHVTRWCE